MSIAKTHRTRIGRRSINNQIYHLTFSTHQRRALFSELSAARIAILAITHSTLPCKTLAFVVMPDHIHWLMQLERGLSLSQTIARIKANITRQLSGVSRPVWQRGFYDRAIRTEEDIQTIARYIVVNPIRAGLVSRLGDYPHWDAIWI
jgi:REP element-mobilizing transposase RayT